MRTILSSAGIAFLFLIIACNGKPANTNTSGTAVNDLAQENLKGEVKQVKTESYPIDSTGKTGTANSKTEEDFDDKGYANTSVTEDSLTTKNTFDHNANGFFTGMNTTVNGKNNLPLSRNSIKMEHIVS